jgi:hypothetical protein
VGNYIRKPFFKVFYDLYRTSCGKNCLKIFGKVKTELGDPETEMIGRDAPASEKQTDQGDMNNPLR